MMKKSLFVLLVVFMFFAFSGQLYAETPRKIVAYFFWGKGCPHCTHEKPFLESLKKKYPGLVVKDYEVWHDVANKRIYQKMSCAYGLTSGSVPATFVHTKSWIGYSPSKAKEIEAVVERCAMEGCLDPAVLSHLPVQEETSTIQLPFVGLVDTSKVSMPLLTLVLAGLDGFNPCAFFVLLMLLSLMVHAQSRMRMLVVGGIFVFFSGFVYFLFMAAWLNLFMVTGRVSFITTGAGAIAVVIALINIKEYFFFKKGISLTLSQQAQGALQGRMRGLIRTGSWGGLIFGTIVLAAMANLYELLCTAGFPMVFTRALTLQHFSTGQYYLYLVFYNSIYVIPLLVIVLIFSTTLGSRKLTEEEGRILKLVSGLMMLGLGSVLVLKPALLNSIAVSVGLVFGVLLIAGLVMWLGRIRRRTHAG
jgi:thiol-disulfide isomerase/thioredoxin